MKFHDIKIRTNTLGSEAISDMLLINGITSFSVSDPNDFAEIVEERSVPFDYYEDDLLPDDRSVAYVDVYIAYTEQGEAQMQAVADGIAALKAENLPFGSLEYTVYETDDKDWENNWKQFFHPINIGNSFVIKPSWEDCTPDGRKVLEIDPESSFGTGRHETTRLCLELLEKTDCNDADVLDMGCGSGILGIGAYLLGAKSITAVDIDEKDDCSTTAAGTNGVFKTALKSVPSLSTRDVITSFAGIRAHSTGDDFIIAPSEKDAKFINVAGIESPGLSSAPAIGLYVCDMILQDMGEVSKKADFIPGRPAPVRFRHMNAEERKALVEKNSAYGRVICRCETITEGEILDAIHAPAGAVDVDGVKRRTRAGMGRCQGGFCGSKVVEILARELGQELDDITKCGGESKILFGKTK